MMKIPGNERPAKSQGGWRPSSIGMHIPLQKAPSALGLADTPPFRALWTGAPLEAIFVFIRADLSIAFPPAALGQACSIKLPFSQVCLPGESGLLRYGLTLSLVHAAACWA